MRSTKEDREAKSQATHLRAGSLAARWQMSKDTLRNWRWSGRGPKWMKIGHIVVYRLVDVEEYERTCLKEPLQ